MAISFRSTSAIEANLVSSVTIPRPAGAAVGDVIVATFFATGDDPEFMSPPAGWVQVGGDGLTSGIINGKVFYRVVDPSDPIEYVFLLSDDETGVLILSCFEGVDNATPIPVMSFGGTAVFTQSHVAPAITMPKPNMAFLTAWGATGAGERSYTEPPGTEEIADISSNTAYASAAWQLITAATTTSTRTAISTIDAGYLSVSIGLLPAGVSPQAEEVIEWVDAKGGVTKLDVEWDVAGRFSPPIAMEEEEVPGQPGAVLRNVRHEARDVALALWFTSPTEGDLRKKLRDVIRRMDPTWGDGFLRVTAPPGDRRELQCRMSGGLEMDEKLGDSSGFFAQKAAVTFRAHQPYWLDANDTVIEFTTGEVDQFFPFFPLKLTASEVFSDGVVDNIGDVEAWPVWTIIGPGQNIVLDNLSTSASTHFETATLLAGETLEVDTRPGHKTVTHSSGENFFPDMTHGSVLWSFMPGVNNIRIQMSGSLEDSKVILTYRPRFLTV